MILIWLAWGVAFLWIARKVNHNWKLYHANDPYAQDPPEFSTFLFIEGVLVSNGLLHMWLDKRPLYPRTETGFLYTGFTEAQLLFGAAWVILIASVTRWFFMATKGNPQARWNFGCLFLVLGLLLTSLFLWLVMDIPLRQDT